MDKIFFILDKDNQRIPANWKEVEEWLEAQKHLILQEQIGNLVVSTIFDICGEFETVILEGELEDDNVGVKNQGVILRQDYSDTYEKAMFIHNYYKWSIS